MKALLPNYRGLFKLPVIYTNNIKLNNINKKSQIKNNNKTYVTKTDRQQINKKLHIRT